MKKLIVLLFCFIAFNGYAQTTATKIDENTVVKDTAGVVVSYENWQKLIQTGDYQLKRPYGQTDFTVYKMTSAEKARIEERRRIQQESMPRPRPTTSFKDGDKFLGYKLTDIKGNKYDIKDAQGKVIVLNFWFINCPPCKQEIPELNRLQAKYKDSADVLFLGIALDPKAELEDFLKTFPFNYNIVDNGRFYAEKHGIRGYPTHVVVGKDGLIKFHTMGLAQNTIYWVEKTIKESLQAP
ncbi:MAG: TlpA family protein disulfide reductase [Flavobacterium sp.]|nr:MAG: TlpA family protein disulfide reductase [Flavobacterium sp.]